MNFPPQATINPVLWKLKALSDPLQLLEQSRQELGDVFQFPSSPVVCVSSPTGLQQIFAAPSDVLRNSQDDAFFRAVLGDNALVFLEGDRHTQHRQLITPAFHGDALTQWATEIVTITRQSLESLQTGKSFVVRSLMKSITLRIILKVVLGASTGSRFDRLYTLLDSLFQGMDNPFSAASLVLPFLKVELGGWSPWGRFVRQKQEINQLIQAEITHQQIYPQPGQSLLSMLLATKDDQGKTLDQAEIADELLTLVFAGYETTTSAVAWALYWTQALQPVQARLEAELEKADLDNPLQVAKLPYLSAVCNEVLRIYPVAIGCFLRRVRQPIEIDGFHLEVGAWIHPSIYLAHHRPETYPQPDQFQPERFLERAFSPYEFLPFGGGSRRCIGGAFARLEMKLIVATILRQCRLKRVDQSPIKPIRYGITMAPPTQLRMQFIGQR